MIFKSYKFRLYPTKEQEILLSKTFGCVRFIYNWGLALKSKYYQENKKGISIFEIDKKIVELKNSEETKWLKEVNSQSLQQSLKHLDSAFTKFFKEKKGYPKFKSKYDKQSFCNPQNTEIDFENNLIWIPKFKKSIKCIFHRQFEGKVKSSTVSKSKSGKYFISILVEVNEELSNKQEPQENLTLGIDLGIKTYATFSNGIKIENPKHLKKKIKKLKRIQKQHSRKKKNSKNREKSRIKLVKIYEKVTNSRQDFLHKLTSSIIKNQDYTSFAIEDLNISGMIKNHKLAQHIQDCAWGTFRQFLEYKASWGGKNVLVVGRFEPSSKMCSCGWMNKELKLKDRFWICNSCGITHDRDILASNNIKRFAFCKQDTKKDLKIGRESSELVFRKKNNTLGEIRVGESENQEAIML